MVAGSVDRDGCWQRGFDSITWEEIQKSPGAPNDPSIVDRDINHTNKRWGKEVWFSGCSSP